MQKLTKAEEEIMQLVWEHGPATVSQLISKLNLEKKPPHSTISSIVRILERKGFVAYNVYGKTYEYYSIITKDNYSRFSLKGLVSNYFGGSMNNLVSFLVKKEDLSISELTDLISRIEEE